MRILAVLAALPCVSAASDTIVGKMGLIPGAIGVEYNSKTFGGSLEFNDYYGTRLQANYRVFLNNSFFIKPSVGIAIDPYYDYHHYHYHYHYHEDSYDRHYHHNMGIVAGITVGNEWVLNGFTIGGEWASLFVTSHAAIYPEFLCLRVGYTFR